VKRDTERQDEIRAMKVAWEAAQPGRAAKVTKLNQTRFINSILYVQSAGLALDFPEALFFWRVFRRKKKKTSIDPEQISGKISPCLTHLLTSALALTSKIVWR
jgi:hypothetical protein